MLRLFLSVDIQGSTIQKNKVNYSTVYSDYLEIKNNLELLLNEDYINSKHDTESLVLESLLSRIKKRKHLDWLESQSKLFEDFNGHFIANLIKNYNKNLSDSDSEKFLWKAIGDELVYVFEVKNRNEIHNICLSFLSAVYYMDEKFSKTNYYRLKASAWTAGFPIRNREIFFPFPQTYTKISENGHENLIDYNYPQLDFIGPDIDIGFRIGKFCWPGILAVSMDLAQLLTECRLPNRLIVRFVGWENLKGVWNDIHYPIFWVNLSKDLIKSEGLKEYDFYSASDIPLSKHLKKYDEIKSTETTDETTGKISKIRQDLPKSLGLVTPYLVDDGDQIPSDHKQISELVEKLKKLEKDKKREREIQNQDLQNSENNIDAAIEEKIESKFESPLNP